MKKIISALLAIVLLMGVSGCDRTKGLISVQEILRQDFYKIYTDINCIVDNCMVERYDIRQDNCGNPFDMFRLYIIVRNIDRSYKGEFTYIIGIDYVGTYPKTLFNEDTRKYEEYVTSRDDIVINYMEIAHNDLKIF